MDCGWVKRHVERILDAEYSPETGDQLAEHLRECRDCARFLDAAEEEERVLQAALPRTDAPRDLTASIMASLPEARRQRPGREPFALLLRWALPVAGAAAVAVVAFGLHFRARQGRDAGRPGVASSHRTIAQPSANETRAEAPVVAVLHGVSGIVQLVSDRGATRSPEPAMALRRDAVLSTAADSAAQLDFAGEVRVSLDSETSVQITSLSSVRLVSGRLFVWVEIKGTRFAVTTPQAEAEVRGTEFCVDSRAEGRTIVTVVEGVVALSTKQGAVDVGAGLQSHAEAGTPPAVPRVVDVPDIVAWARTTEEDAAPRLGVRLRARLDQDADAGKPKAPTLVVELGYSDGAYVPLWLNCEITDRQGRAVSEQSVQISTMSHRYRVRKVRPADLVAGRYRASLRLVGRADSNSTTLEFEVK